MTTVTYSNEIINEIKQSLKKLSELEAIADAAEVKYSEDPENEQLENAFDEAYEKQYLVFDNVCKMIASLINIDYKLARKMMTTEREKIISLLDQVK